MDFTFSEEQKKLMKEIGEFCINELPEDYDPDYIGGPRDQGTHDFMKQFHQKGVKGGWPTAGWPKKYGGLGLTFMEQAAINSEMAYWGATWGGDAELILVAPTILTVGTEEQKQKWIPPIIRGDVTAFQAFTEPEAGSDEANCQLRAVADGDDFVLNGQKTFITGQVKPTLLYTLAKTADIPNKHRGLSIFMVPGDAQGITYRPLPTMGGSMQNEIFFDNVRIPKTNLLGELNRGFYVAMATFEFERGTGGGLGAKRSMETIIEFCREQKRNGKPLYQDPKAREMIARLAINSHLGFLQGWWVTWQRENKNKLGGPPRNTTTVFPKSVFQVYEGESLMRVMGLYGQLKRNSKYVKYKGKASYKWEKKNAIHGGGSPEIRKVVVADRGLGLPRIPRQFNAQIRESLQKEEKQ